MGPWALIAIAVGVIAFARATPTHISHHHLTVVSQTAVIHCCPLYPNGRQSQKPWGEPSQGRQAGLLTFLAMGCQAVPMARVQAQEGKPHASSQRYVHPPLAPPSPAPPNQNRPRKRASTWHYAPTCRTQVRIGLYSLGLSSQPIKHLSLAIIRTYWAHRKVLRFGWGLVRGGVWCCPDHPHHPYGLHRTPTPGPPCSPNPSQPPKQ